MRLLPLIILSIFNVVSSTGFRIFFIIAGAIIKEMINIERIIRIIPGIIFMNTDIMLSKLRDTLKTKLLGSKMA